MKTTFIYALCEPDGGVRYVGKADDPQLRLSQHCREKTRNPRKRVWIEGLRLRGLKPQLQILETVPVAVCFEAERRWIASYRAQGAELVNGRVGGIRPGIEPRGFPRRLAVPVIPIDAAAYKAALARMAPDGPSRGLAATREALRVALCAALQAENLSISDAAAEFGVARETVARWVNGKGPVAMEDIISSDRVAELFCARMTWELAEIDGKAA